MRLEILLSCMHRTDGLIVEESGILGDALVINQCDREEIQEFPTKKGRAIIYSTTARGLTKSRNEAIEKSRADICMLCDDDEVFAPDYEEKILSAYETLDDADIIVFKMINRPTSLGDKTVRIKFPKTMKVSSWQISFRRESLIKTGVRFDPLLGAGTENGAEEELKFLLDCQRAGLKIYYVPKEIAEVGQTESTWFKGFSRQFFINRGATTRYILGFFPACLYALYYIIKKRREYGGQISPIKATKAIFYGIFENKIKRQKGR